MKTCAIVLELLTVLAGFSTERDPRLPGGLEGISGKHVQLVSANFKGASNSASYLKNLKFCMSHIHDAQQRDSETPIQEGLALNAIIINQYF